MTLPDLKWYSTYVEIEVVAGDDSLPGAIVYTSHERIYIVEFDQLLFVASAAFFHGLHEYEGTCWILWEDLIPLQDKILELIERSEKIAEIKTELVKLAQNRR